MSDDYRYTERSGGCQCGAVRFHAAELRDNPHVCHCRMCQKAAGNLFAALVGVYHHHLTWTRGQPAEFMSSEQAARGFCRDCGTSLYYRGVGGEHVSLSIGAFDDPQSIPVLYQMGTEAKHPVFEHFHGAKTIGTTEETMSDKVDFIRSSNHQHPDHDTTDWPNHTA